MHKLYINIKWGLYQYSASLQQQKTCNTFGKSSVKMYSDCKAQKQPYTMWEFQYENLVYMAIDNKGEVQYFTT
jgi:hypothetical protein